MAKACRNSWQKPFLRPRPRSLAWISSVAASARRPPRSARRSGCRGRSQRRPPTNPGPSRPQSRWPSKGSAPPGRAGSARPPGRSPPGPAAPPRPPPHSRTCPGRSSPHTACPCGSAPSAPTSRPTAERRYARPGPFRGHAVPFGSPLGPLRSSLDLLNVWLMPLRSRRGCRRASERRSMAFSGLAAAAWRGSLSQRANAFATEERSACHRVLLASKRVSLGEENQVFLNVLPCPRP